MGRLREALRVLRWSRREQKTALLGGACFAALPLVRQLPLEAPILAVATWVLVGLGSVAWVLTAWRLWRYSLAPPAPEVDDGGVAIKGASAFTPEDAELFSRLGRLDELKQLRSWARDASKVPVVAVMGESGVGKTSLLRAGLAFILGKGDEPIPYAYWEADPAGARESFLRAVEAQLGSRDLAALPRSVIVADQLEQLDPERDADLFTLLFEHLEREPPVLVTWVLAFRREFASTWWDLLLDVPEPFRHRPQMLSLQRFSVRQAKEIFATLAERADLPVRQSLAEQIVEQIAEGGRVSPVDLGITLQVLHRQPDLAEDPAAFRSLGGHAGLLTSYLEMILETHPPALREEVFRALLGLIDEDEDRRRPEGRSLDELLETVRPRAPRHLALALEVLAQPAVRVLERVDGTPLRYRLVHERFIPAIRRLSGDLLGAADRASRLLERRFRLWQREGESARYLLEGRELRQVLAQGGALLWGADRQEKLAFLRRSRRRRAARWLTAAGVVALVTVGAAWAVQDQRARAVQKDLFEWGFPAGTYELLPRITSIATPPVTNTRWLSRAHRLTELHLSFAPQYAPGERETLPPSLRRLHLHVGGMETSKWPELPASLEQLTLALSGQERADSWPELPSSLRRLTLLGTVEDKSWPQFPPTLEQLTIVLSDLGFSGTATKVAPSWPQIPQHLKKLTIHLALTGPVGKWPELPPSLRELSISTGGDEDLPRLERLPSLRRLDLQFWSSEERELPDLPPSLRSLSIDFHLEGTPRTGWSTLQELALRRSPRTAWPDLPQNLRRLTLRERVFDLPWPVLPSTVLHLTLYARGSDTTTWPHLPPALKELNIVFAEFFRSRIPDWPELPPSLERLSIHAGAASDFPLPEYPASLRFLSITSDSEIRAELPELPPDLRGLVLQLPGGATRLPELPPALQQITLDLRSSNLTAFPDLSSLPLERLDLDLRGTGFRDWPALPSSLRCLALTLDKATSAALPIPPPTVEQLSIDLGILPSPSFSCRPEVE